MFNNLQRKQEAEMMQALQEHYANRDKPKPPVPLNNEYAEYLRATERHTARENAKRMEELAAAFAKRNAQRVAKSK